MTTPNTTPMASEFFLGFYIGNLMMLGVLYLGGSTAKKHVFVPLFGLGSRSFSFSRPSIKNLSDDMFCDVC